VSAADGGRGARPGAGSSPPGRSSRVKPLGAVDPTRIGPYRLEGLLGRGGMGSVYLGRTSTGRDVAVKVVKAEYAADPGYQRLFEQEARLARGIVRSATPEFIDAGTYDGQPYIVTEYIPGPTLEEAIWDDGPLEPAALDRVALAVATALTAIHRAGVVHRDLKPSNVLLSVHGPLVIDFGIALAVDSATMRGGDGSGTPAYMAPEQVTRGRVGPAADIFAWAGVVVFAATGHPPFGDGPVHAQLYRVVNEQPDLTGVPEPLRSVVALAMNRDPAQRPTAAQLFNRLVAAPPTGATTSSAGPARSRGGEPTAPAPGVPSTPKVPRTPDIPGAADEGGWPAGGRPGGARSLGRGPDTLPGRPGPAVPFPPVSQRPDSASPGHSRGMPPPGAGPSGAPAGAAAGAGRPSAGSSAAGIGGRAGSPAGTAPRADSSAPPSSRREGDTTPAPGGLRRRLGTRRGRLAVTAAAAAVALAVALPLLLVLPGRGEDGGPQAARRASQELAAQARRIRDADPALARRLALAAYRAAPTAEARLSLLAAYLSPGKSAATFSGHTSSIGDATLSPDGKLLATTGTEDHTARLWDTGRRGDSAKPLVTLTGHAGWLGDVAFSPDGRLMATCSADGTAKLWDTSSRGNGVTPLATFVGHTDGVWDVTFSPDGKLLATGSVDGTARLWDTSARGPGVPPLATFAGHTAVVGGVEFSPDGKLLASGSHDGVAKLWSTADRGDGPKPVTTLLGHTAGINEFAFSPDGKLLATASDDTTARLWDITQPGVIHPRATFKGHVGSAGDVAFSPDGRLVATTSEDSTARLWDTTATGEDVSPVASLTGHASTVNDVVFSPDGLLLATSGVDGVALLWDPSERGPNVIPLATLAGHQGAVDDVLFTPDSLLLATTAKDRTARLWDLAPDDIAASACLDGANILTQDEWSPVVKDVRYRSPCP